MANFNSYKSSQRSSSLLKPWSSRQWLISLILFLVVWVGLYLYSHSDKGYRGYEYAGFNNEQIQHIKLVLYKDMVYPDGYINPARKVQPTPVYADTNNNVVAEADTAAAGTDTNAIASTEAPVMTEEEEIDSRLICDDSCKSNKALLYVRNEFDNRLRDDQLQTIQAYITTFSAGEVDVFLGDLKLKVNSYFWLSGPLLYAELVFWTIFGVLCSMLFTFTVMMRTGYGTSDNEITYQIAKFFYAPFCTIVLILAYNYLKDKNAFDIRASEGIIVLAFLIGFFSDKIMNFLDRLKDSVLPGSRQYAPEKSYAPEVAMQYAPPVQQYRQQHPGTEPQPHQSQPEPQHTPTAWQPDIGYSTYTPEETKTESYYNEGSQTAQTKADNAIIKDEDGAGDMSSHMPVTFESNAKGLEVRIDVKLEATGLYGEEIEEIKKKGFGRAIVTLHSVSGKNIIPTRRIGDERSSHFLAQNVEPGIYIARATLAQKMNEEYMINLFGEKTAYVTPDRPDVELFIKKYESKT